MVVVVAMLCRRGWFVYSLSLCEDYIYNNLSSNSGFNSPLGGSGIARVVSRTSWFIPSECKWTAAQAQKDQTDLVTSSFHAQPLAKWALA